ncbi:MAG: PhzF family phenazine biosynthesis protein [Euryarchaeota archaeon]|nr:PhzF family phenazine biosynthesis protein [Euryarchaeota archaeon]
MRIFQVNSFTNKPFTGNPAGVCILSEDIPDSEMLNIAKEMNLPETAFLQENDTGYNLRWFTPCTEIELCGHATLASAHILWETGDLSPDEIVHFDTLSGELTAKRNGEWIDLDFPAEYETNADAPVEISDALGVQPIYVGKNRFDYIVEVESEEIVRSINPNFGLLKKIPSRGIIVTSRADTDKYDFVSRFFAPAIGVDEDPVTGSAHCCLGPYWESRLNKSRLEAFQSSERGGVVRVEVKSGRVILSGQAVTVIEGEIIL